MADRTGQQLGNYHLVTLLGQGGYAEVYLGQHVRFNQQAAIKVLHAHLTGSEAEHFQHEAETIAQLAHPAIVRVFDFDVQDSVPFLVMDYAPNGSLRKRYPKGSLVPLPQILSSVKQVAAALQYAHEQKFIHRDVKPENMLLGRQREVLLSDFGLAALAHSTASLSPQETIGTIAYMAPEQIEGHPRAASDQYALGVAVYEWLCGERPFEGSVTEVMVQHLTMPPPPLHEKVTTIPAQVEQVVLRALEKDPKARFSTVHDFATALEQASQRTLASTAQLASEQSTPGAPFVADFATVAVPNEAPPALVASSASPEAPPEPDTPPGQAGKVALTATTPAAPFEATTPAPAGVPLLPGSDRPRRRRTIVGLPAGLLIGLAVLVIAAGILGSLSLLAHFGVIGVHSSATTSIVVRGGTWVVDRDGDPGSLIPNGGGDNGMDEALYLPLFYGDAQGVVHPDAATEVPTLQNGGISPDVKTWTFHLRPHLLWSDGAPYDARDVDFTWQLWLNPKFGAAFPNGATGFELIRSADVSADHLTITFHLKQAYAPFLSYWVDGEFASLPAHHFSLMAPQTILKSPDNLNPQVTSGPFMMGESEPGDHYTLVRNPRYYRAREGLPYLDKVVFREGPNLPIKVVLQTQTFDVYGPVGVPDVTQVRLSGYRLVTSPTQATFEGMFFNFHNRVLASHLEVRQAMAMAVDQQALIQMARYGFATSLCTDHPSAYHPGYQPGDPGSLNCPGFDLAAANKLLNDNGWVKGSDGVRTRDGQRLEFEYSTTTNADWRSHDEAILQRNFAAIGIKLDIQNYPGNILFNSILPAGKASPPTGAVAGRYDIIEAQVGYGYDPDDSTLLSCDQIPSAANNSSGSNIDFYCNPALDALYKQELATVDPGVRQQVFEQIHQIYLTDFPFITLFSPIYPWIVRNGTHNYLPGPFTDTYNVAEWWCDGRKC
jgi:peptide/nickel transport system substrate-binding protein